MSTDYELTIGLEIHAQLMTTSKAFCFVPTSFGAQDNSMVGPVSAGLPGALPVLNKKAVELAVRAGHCLNCQIQTTSLFARKNYFYPDLPKGYQISQFDKPLCTNGWIEVDLNAGHKKKVSIERIHMEEDAGKSTHFGSSSLVNLNRAGMPLIEIVTRPEIHSAGEAVAFLKKLHSILTFAKVTDGNMEEGNFRCDVNLSIKPPGATQLGTRTEIKNLNSFRFIEKAIAYESARQIALVQNGESVVQETRGWDAALDKTFSQRSKEDAHDYRYFPDPDLPPLIISQMEIDRIIGETPELPDAKRSRFVSRYGLSDYDARQLTASSQIASYFEQCVALGAPAKASANWILGDILAHLKDHPTLDLETQKLSPAHLCDLIALIDNKIISGKIAKSIFGDLFLTGEMPSSLVKHRGLSQVTDVDALEGWVNKVVSENPSVVAEYLQGKTKVFGFLVGQVMKLSEGKASPEQVTQLIRKAIGS